MLKDGFFYCVWQRCYKTLLLQGTLTNSQLMYIARSMITNYQGYMPGFRSKLWCHPRTVYVWMRRIDFTCFKKFLNCDFLLERRKQRKTVFFLLICFFVVQIHRFSRTNNLKAVDLYFTSLFFLYISSLEYWPQCTPFPSPPLHLILPFLKSEKLPQLL